MARTVDISTNKTYIWHYGRTKRSWYRSKYDTILSVLKSTQGYGGASITQILRESCISYKQAKKYLTLLIESKFVVYTKEEKKFRITESGIYVLKLYGEMNKLLFLEITKRSAK
jgi:predicted transcriptional regulator